MSGATQFQSQRFQMPESVSWISVDHYHFTPDPDYVVMLLRTLPLDVCESSALGGV